MHTGIPGSSDGAAGPCSQPFRGAQCMSCMDLVQTNPSWRGEGSSVKGSNNSSPAGPAWHGQGTTFPEASQAETWEHKTHSSGWHLGLQLPDAASVWPWGRRAGAEQVCRKRPVGQFGSAASSWLLRATAVSRKCALGGWYLRGVERNFGTGVGVWVGAVLPVLCAPDSGQRETPELPTSHPNPGLVSPVS